MDKTVFYIQTGSVEPDYNLALEEYILTHRTAGSYLLLWQNDNAIILGQNQNMAAEIDPLFVRAHQIRVVRRSTGGGAVYHDLGNLNYSFITDWDVCGEDVGQSFVLPVVRALRELGLAAEGSGRNDILVEEKKVSGTAQRICGSRILHHGTLLFDSDLDVLSCALKTDPEKFQTKNIRSVRSRVANIRQMLKSDMDLDSFRDHMLRSLTRGQYVPQSLSTRELEAVEQIRADKYGNPAWNRGREGHYTLCNRRRWNGGSVEFCAAVDGGLMTEVAFFGDFLSARPLDELVQALRGCPFLPGAVEAVFRRQPINEYFGAVSMARSWKRSLADLQRASGAVSRPAP